LKQGYQNIYIVSIQLIISDDMKGITPVIAVILLLMITISLVGFAFIWFSGLTKSITNQTSEHLEQQMRAMTSDFRIENVAGDKVYIRNIGTSEINKEGIGIYANNIKLDFTLQGDKIGPNEVKEIVLDRNLTSCTTSISLKIVSGIWEHSQNVDYCDAISVWHFDGDAKDSKGKNDGTIYGATWSSDCISGSCLSFDGIDDYVEVPIVSLTNKVTVEAWSFYIDGQVSGDYVGIINNLNGYPNYNRLLLKPTEILFQLAINGNLINHRVLNLPDLRNNWHHYVATYDGSVVKIFLDGKEVYSGSQTGNLDSGGKKPTIGWGSTNPSYYHLKGLIDEVSIYNRALTAKEIELHAARY